MTYLPKFEWNIDPVFLRLPRELVVGALGVLAAVSLITGLKKRQNDQFVTALIFGGLSILAYRFVKEDFDLRYYSLIFLGVFLGGYGLLKWQIVRGGGRADDAGDFIVYGVLGVLVGARLGHVLFYDLDKAIKDPLWILEIWTGGLASHGATLGLIFAMWLFTRRRGIPFLEGADRFSFSAALGATLVRIGNLFNSEIVGRKVPDQSWGVWFSNIDRETPIYRYPSQFLEIALGLIVLGSLFVIDRKLGREKRPRGAMIAAFFTLYFTLRLFTEFFKEYEGISNQSPVTMGQILSLPPALLGWYGLFWALKKKIPVGWPRRADEDDDADAEKAADKGKKRKKRKKKSVSEQTAEGGEATAGSLAAEDAVTESKDAERPDDSPVDEDAEKARADDTDDTDEDEGDEEREEDEREEDDEDEEERDEGEGEEDDEGEDEEDEDDTASNPDASEEAPQSGDEAKPGDPDVDEEFDKDGKLRRNRNPG